MHDALSNVQLPDGLIPLCRLGYAQRLRPEAVDIIKAFAQAGVSIKVFSSHDLDRMVAVFQAAGLKTEDERQLRTIGMVAGRELAQIPPADWARVAAKNSVFDHVTPPRPANWCARCAGAGRRWR